MLIRKLQYEKILLVGGHGEKEVKKKTSSKKLEFKSQAKRE